jgi:hypothetical protein
MLSAQFWHISAGTRAFARLEAAEMSSAVLMRRSRQSERVA